MDIQAQLREYRAKHMQDDRAKKGATDTAEAAVESAVGNEGNVHIKEEPLADIISETSKSPNTKGLFTPRLEDFMATVKKEEEDVMLIDSDPEDVDSDLSIVSVKLNGSKPDKELVALPSRKRKRPSAEINLREIIDLTSGDSSSDESSSPVECGRFLKFSHTAREHTPTLFPYQTPHADHLYNVLTKEHRAIDASDTGTGKTFMAMHNAKRLGLKPFVVCPKSVIPTWIEVAETYGVELLGISNYEMDDNDALSTPVEDVLETETVGESFLLHPLHLPKRPKCQPEISYEFNFPPKTLIIFDEVHRCKNFHSKNSKLLSAASKLPKEDNKILILSATLCDTVRHFVPFGVFFGFYDEAENFKYWTRVQMEHMELGDCQWRGKCINIMEELLSDEKRLQVIHKAIFPQYGSRIRIQDLKDVFPENTIEAKAYYLKEALEVQNRYEQIRLALKELEAEGKRTAGLGAIVKARQQIEVLKVPMFLTEAAKFLDAGQSVAIFANFNETLNLLKTNLKRYKPVVVRGDQTVSERHTSIARFQEDRSRLILLNIAAGGVGLSLHDVKGGHPRVALINPTWSGQDMLQAFGRIHRAGGKSASRQFLLYCEGTIEERICRTVNQKIKNMNAFNDGELDLGILIKRLEKRSERG
ncbi:hypothetical protein HK097_009307 [Rhizophlyctis rosea]|uniref:Uncharacterized protein n=1 Tax=Rhizophlyctis rosea TaxID=64517 RepID=A0AAD5SAR1_9FUNG|nr:hypothetical protein HK097_009307 [Rhizophlyctis rosea]